MNFNWIIFFQTFKSKTSRYAIQVFCVVFFLLRTISSWVRFIKLDLKLTSNSDLHRKIKLSWSFPFPWLCAPFPCYAQFSFGEITLLWRWQHYLCQIVSSVCSWAVQPSSISCLFCLHFTHTHSFATFQGFSLEHWVKGCVSLKGRQEFFF